MTTDLAAADTAITYARKFLAPTLIGLGALFLAFVFLVTSSAPATDVDASGSVLEVSGDGQCSVEAIFAVGQAVHEATTWKTSESNCDLDVGDTIAVHYDAADPDTAYAGPAEGARRSTLLLAPGVLLLLAGLGWLGRSRVADFAEARRGSRAVRAREKAVTPEEREAWAEAISVADHTSDEPESSVDGPAVPLRRGNRQAHPLTGPLTEPGDAYDADDDLGTFGEDDAFSEALWPGDDASPLSMPALDPDPDPDLGVPAGWYPTADGGQVRWHDGREWTEHVQAAPTRD